MGPWTGFVLRSAVVRGWPGLQARAWGKVAGDAASDELSLIRMDRLSPNVLMCIFTDPGGEMAAVDIQEKPETVHFGFDQIAPGVEPYTKKLMDSQFKASSQTVPVTLKERVVDVNKLYADVSAKDSALGFKSFSAAQFGLALVEAVGRLRFIKGGP